MLEVANLYAGYGGEDIIKNITVTAAGGECLCVLGPNGCGKSTLLKAIARIIEYRGQVTLDSRNTAAFSRKELAKKIALLGQSTQVFFPYTVWETVSLGRYAYSTGFLKSLSAEDRTVIEDTIKRLDLWNIKDRRIDELSGGQLQRVFLAKTLAQNPAVILLDEPTNHLDLKNQIDLLEFLKSWVSQPPAVPGRVLIGVFHDLNLARQFGDSALLMQDGEIVTAGPVAQTLNGETLREVYGIDIRGFMLESLERWRQ